MMTANGVVDVKKVVRLPLFSDGGSFDALVMEDSPSVLSLGKMCMEAGFSFVWKFGLKPVLQTPSGKIMHLEVL